MSMEQVKFSSRHAIGIMYDDSITQLNDLTWSVKYFPDDSIISFAALDNRKRGTFLSINILHKLP